MKVEIINIGDELLIGQVVNTNAAWMARALNDAGLRVCRVSVVADQGDPIKDAIDHALAQSDAVLVTGGLGPTKDDITKHVLCEYYDSSLVFNEPAFENIKRLLKLRGREIREHHKRQAEIPDKCIPVENKFGTAPGLWFEQGGKILVSMPGVPFEMEAMMEEHIIPSLAGFNTADISYHKTILTHGIGESYLAEKITPWEDQLPPYIKLAFLPQPGIVRLRLSTRQRHKNVAEKEIEKQIEKLQMLIPELIFGYGDDTMEEVVGNLLRQQGKTLTTAESCTGGYLAHLITSVPGSSDYYTGSVVSYANDIKEQALSVRHDSLEAYGAVSEQVVKEMAEGIRQGFHSDYALATSGIAGPDGGTPEKPVGTVWVALAAPDKTIVKKFRFGEHRGRNIRRSALAALNMLRLELRSDSSHPPRK